MRCIYALILCGGALAQRPEFEVASVKVNKGNGPSDFAPRRSGDLVTMHNTRLYSMIFYAYHLSGDYQMVKAPEDYEWYDVDARAGEGATDGQIRLMLQALLADRFGLKAHRETREIPVFEMVVYKGKPKLTAAGDGPMKLTIEGKNFAAREGKCGVSLWAEGDHLVCHAVGAGTIAETVGGQLRAPVVDRTGLTGTYDVNVLFAPEHWKVETDEAAPSLAEALQTELGLRLEKGKGQVEVVVIDAVGKLSGN